MGALKYASFLFLGTFLKLGFLFNNYTCGMVHAMFICPSLVFEMLEYVLVILCSLYLTWTILKKVYEIIDRMVLPNDNE